MMKGLLRWIGIALGSLAVLAIIAYGVLYVLSERALRRTYVATPAVALSIPTDPASIIEGQRLATVHGCLGCHGKQAEGMVLFDKLMIARIVAPNLTATVREYGAAEVGLAIRHGVEPGGSRSLVVMPSQMFVGLNDGDLGRIIAFLKSLPPVAGPGQSLRLGPLGCLAIANGEFKTAAQLIAETRSPPEATNEAAAYGRYLAQTTCAGCHGTNLRGDHTFDGDSPSLRVVAAYSSEAFTQLLRTGVPLGERKLGLMREVAREQLSHLTDVEIADLYSYLRTMPP